MKNTKDAIAGFAAATGSALELFNRAFSGARTPRSPEYKAGVLAHMKYRMKESDNANCPYAEGTSQADAWWSGVTESWRILEANGADARRPNAGTQRPGSRDAGIATGAAQPGR